MMDWQDMPWPDWQDGGKRVEIRLADGSAIEGRLEIVDQTPGPDEAPLFDVVADDGRRVPFWNNEAWRWTKT